MRINTRSATHLLTIMSSHPVAYFLGILGTVTGFFLDTTLNYPLSSRSWDFSQ